MNLQIERNEPLHVLFLVTSMPVGGAETLLMNLVRRMDRTRFAPEIGCLKEPGPLGEALAEELPVHSGFTTGRYDVRVLGRLARLMRERQIDAVVTVAAGDKMFWGRLAARWAGVPVIASALHSTGWPDGIGRLNRMLTPITDAFIGVAEPHGRHLVENEGFPTERVHVIPNGVDTDRFKPPVDPATTRRKLGLPEAAPVVGILAALRPEKNHELFLRAASRIRQKVRDAEFVIIGDGPRCVDLKLLADELSIAEAVHFLGNRDDVPEVLGALDAVALTSHNEANPVSILEAMSVGKPVVATDVGSVRETVKQGVTGHVVPAGDEAAVAERLVELLCDPLRSQQMGQRGRAMVEQGWSLDAMVGGYERLLAELFTRKTGQSLPESESGNAAGAQPSEKAVKPVAVG